MDKDTAPALLFEQVSYSVNKRSFFTRPPLINKKKVIIENCNGVVNRGELVAIMGSSGAGKSTLLDVLAKRKTFGNIEGTILYNGKEIKSSHLPTNIAGYVRQDDYHFGELTVRQTLNYAADLRCKATKQEKTDKILYLIKALSLTLAANNKVGDRETRGISGGESRRLSIAIEMLNDPDLLFLDEPTSGLDSASSKNAILLLRRLVRTRKNAAVCTIHQPSREVFEYFDKVILLGKSEAGIGSIAYYGPSLGVIPYFTKLGFPPSSSRVNPADHMIQLCSYKRDVSLINEDEEEEKILKRARAVTEVKLGIRATIDDDEESQVGLKPKPDESNKVQEVMDAFQDSTELAELKKDIERSKALPPANRETTWKPLNIISQVSVLTRRQYQCIFNDTGRLIGTVLVLVILGVIMSTGYWRLSYDSLDIQNRISLLFFLLLSCYMTAEPIFGKIPRERVLVNHEKGAKLYGTLPYFLSTIFAVVPIQLYCCQIYVTVIYWISNLHAEFYNYAIFMIIYTITCFVLMFYALLLGAISATVEVALTISAIVFTIMLLFCGFFLLSSSIPGWWIWAHWASPLKYSFYVCIVNEFEGVQFDKCDSGDVCNFSDGDQLLKYYNADDTHLKWPYIGVTFGFALIFAVVLYFCLRFFKFEKR